MPDPHYDPAEQEQNRVTGMVPLDSLNDYAVEETAKEPAPFKQEPAPFKQEPLFNKKVMIAWAGFAFAIWFAASFVVPAVFHSVKMSIGQSIKEIETAGPDGRTKIIILPNGKRITIRTDGPEVGTPVPADPAAAAAPAKPPVPTAPPAPVLAPAPSARK